MLRNENEEYKLKPLKNHIEQADFDEYSLIADLGVTRTANLL